MGSMVKKIFVTSLCCLFLFCSFSIPVRAMELHSKSAVLMEASTGTVLLDQDGNARMAPASVTKVMTLLLIFQALDQGKIRLDDMVTVSEHAAGMGGSQVFLEPLEQQTVETMIKCISIASANDAAVAMAEHISGSEEAFVEKMNETAKKLSMKNTHFVNCCGLDAEDHYTSAMDIAIMSRELITKYPQVHDYCTVWQEDITHETAKGSFPFTLTNTNKLIKQYPYATGLKTGSTSIAKFCLSATATKDDMTFIAVVMAAENPKIRFADATTLLEYGFSNTSIYKDKEADDEILLPVAKGTVSSTGVKGEKEFLYLSTNGENLAKVKKKVELPEQIQAPVKKGDQVGTITYSIDKKEIGTLPLIATETIPRATITDYIKDSCLQFFHIQISR